MTEMRPHESGCAGSEHAELRDGWGNVVRRIRTCCAPLAPPPPPPSPADLQRQAVDDWLTRQRQLAEETP